jgi:RHS repeat-associated protein
LGSTSLLSDGDGDQVPGSRVSYYPYGQTRAGDLATLPTDFGFTGQRNDATIGLYDYHARWYDPALGRFISADTLVPDPASPQDFNRYTYVSNNPLRYVDPTGHRDMGLREQEMWDWTLHDKLHTVDKGDWGQGWTAKDTGVVLWAVGTIAGAASLPSLGRAAVTTVGDAALKFSIAHPLEFIFTKAVAEEAVEAVITGTPFDPAMVALDILTQGGDDLLPRKRRRPDLYRGGGPDTPNFQLRTPDKPYRNGGWDITLDPEGYVGPGSGGWSTSSELRPHWKYPWRYPADAPEPEGVKIYQDIPDTDPTHWSWAPAYRMPYEEFKQRVRSSRSHWERLER